MNSEDTPEQDPFGPYHEFHWNGLDPVQLSKEYSLNPLVQLTFELNVLTEHAYEAKKKESEFGGKWSEIYLRAKAYQEEAMAYVKELLKSNRLIN